MIHHTGRTILAAAIAVAGFSTIGHAQPARDTIIAFYKTWSEATASEGPSGYAKFFVPTGRVVPPGQAAVIGRDSIRAWMERTQREATTTTQPESITQDEITIAGHYAMVITLMRGRRVPKDGGAPVPFEARYVDVLERTPTGWMFAYRTWTDSVRAPGQSGDPPVID